MSDQSIPLFQVLIEEYNHQQSQGVQYEGLLEARKRYDEIGKDDVEGRKKLNSSEVRKFYGWLHSKGVDRSALCLSGGGIRSATFGLGILQGLARKGLLDKFDFLSTVSGGGYLGSWLSAWIHRRGLAKVKEKLKNKSPLSPLTPEPGPIVHLRSYSNFLTPKLGLLSADTWTLVTIFLRNLILNWLILIPLILLVLMIPRFCFLFVAYSPLRLIDIAPESLQGILRWLLPGGSSGTFWLADILGIMAIAYIYANRPSRADWYLRDPAKPGRIVPNLNKFKTQGWFLVLCLMPLLLLAVFITTYYAWLQVDVKKEWANFIYFGVSLNILGLALVLLTTVLRLRGLFARLKRHFIRWILAEIFVAFATGAVGGILTWLVAYKIFPNPSASVETVAAYVCFAAPAFLTIFLLSATIFLGLSSKRMSDADREWAARAGAWIMISSLLWVVVSVTVIYGPLLLVYGAKTAIGSISVGSVTGIATLLLGRSSKTSTKGKSRSSASDVILTIAPPIFALFILTCLSFGVSWLAVELGNFEKATLTTYEGLLKVMFETPFVLLLEMFGIFLLIGIGASWFVNVNKFSLNGMYRDRLIRAYLGASRDERERTPNPFTGLDENDNLQMQHLRTQLFHEDNINVAGLNRFVQLLQTAGTKLTSKWRLRRLRDENYAVDISIYIWGRLSEKAKNLVNSFNNEVGIEDELKWALIDDFNRILQGASIYLADRFESYDLSREVTELIEQVPCVETLRLNRLLLEHAYPDVFTPVLERKLLHVVNMTLNLVGGKNLAWQNRQAESFTVSALHSGSYCLGYRDSREYALSKDDEAISLGTAAAISGAAVSPSMGNYSSTFVTFLLSLFNLRMGWWLGNPGSAGSHGLRTTWDKAGPNLAARPLIDETLGLTDDQHPYVYLSDGGHFENLALYEMVLRRCKRIVISDGSCDPDFGLEGLGEAVSKIRVDLGVPIEIRQIFMLPRDEAEDSRRYGEVNSKFLKKYCAIGRICYSSVDRDDPTSAESKYDGLLIYIKAFLSGTEPVDVYHYARTHKTFPHESTADQWFSESQFESYRALGSHLVDKICESMPSGSQDLKEFFEFVERDLSAS